MKINITYSFISLLLVSTLLGCSSNSSTLDTSLDRGALKKNKISVIKLMSSKNLTPQPGKAGVTGGMAGGLIGGLIGGAIDNNTRSKRTKAMKPITDALGSYEVRRVFSDKLNRISGDSFNSNLKMELYDRLPLVKDNELLVIAKYILSANHQMLTIDGTSQHQISDDAEYFSKAFSVKTKIPTDSQQSATQYLAKNPQVLKNIINTSLDKIVKDIANQYNGVAE